MRRKSFWRAASLAKLARRADILYRPSRGVLADDFPKKSFGRRFIRARVDGAKIFLPERHESGALYSAIGCNAFVDIPAGSEALKAGAFGENLLADAFDSKSLPLGTRLQCGDVFFEVTQIGKECHSHCAIYRQVGDCIMPREGIFARILHGGKISVGDELKLAAKKIPLDAAIITVSARRLSWAARRGRKRRQMRGTLDGSGLQNFFADDAREGTVGR